MTVADALRKLWDSGLQVLGRRRESASVIQGLPEGISYEVLDDLCREQWGDRLQDVSHVHLSGWKLAGPFRLFLRTQQGHRWTLIYKNAVYDDHHFPGLIGFPLKLGHPEYLVYSNASGALVQYLPAIYRCIEIVPGSQYQYLLEDIGKSHRQASSPEDILYAAAQLRILHGALQEWSTSADQERLLRFDMDFLASFREYVTHHLRPYARATRDESVSEVCERWPQISRYCLLRDFQELEPTRPIHGDFCPSNILIQRKPPNQIKLIDWEWAGIGVAHLDLATLLKRATPELEEQALRIFADQYNHLSLEDHRRLYLWCKMRHGLLDAAYGAAQQMGSPHSLGLDLRTGIAAGAQLALRAFEALTQMGV